ncbi:MAG: helix-turn-helix domain-containing protein [Candidatus Nitrosocaldus sp.]
MSNNSKNSDDSSSSGNNSNVVCLCPLEGIIDIISKKWSLLIINEIGNHGKLRFNDLMRELKPISPKTLADLLKELHNAGLIDRHVYNEIPPRVEYTLTNEGKSLREAIIPLLRWAIEKEGTVVAHCSCTLINKEQEQA